MVEQVITQFILLWTITIQKNQKHKKVESEKNFQQLKFRLAGFGIMEEFDKVCKFAIDTLNPN